MVDVIIPVYRPDEKLEKLIEYLALQTVKPDHIYFMMTMTREAEDQKVFSLLNHVPDSTVIPIQKKEFDHGGTRNFGADSSEAEFILFMTQDAVPADDFLIENLLRPMQDEKVAIVYGRQLPGEEVGVIERYTRGFNYPEKSFVKSKADLGRLGIKTYFCSNVCAVYRKKVYDELGGFVTRTIFNEDMIMAAKAIGAGYNIAYAADARVVHAHKYSYWEQLTRNFDMAVSQKQYAEIFSKVKSEDEGKKLVKKTYKYLLKKGKFYYVPDLIFQSGFKYIGYKLGLRYDRLPKWLVRKCSMNKLYWE